MKSGSREKWLFWGILLGAVLIRCIGFGKVPEGANQDGAMAAVDALALSKYGTDRYGTYMPVHFEAWKYGQMSVLMSYMMIPFIKLFGLNVYTMRLPMLVVSCGSVALTYFIGRKLFDTRFALLVMALTAVNPWHFMQSRWALDCNMFPHVFLLALYLLLLGLEKRRYLYVSMVFFGLTFYCYGVAIYSVTPFLIAFALWCLWKKQLKLREVLACVVIFALVVLPEVLVMAINMFGWPTIETPFFTMSYFPESIRSRDILFLNFSFEQLGRNVRSMISRAFLQQPDSIYNALPKFGPMYHISIPFMLIGIVSFAKELFAEKDLNRKTALLALWSMFIMGIWVGMVTFEVNVNRINIIFFPLLFLCGYGIRWTVRKWRVWKVVVLGAYAICAVLFVNTYFTWFAENIKTYFNVDFLQAMEKADAGEYDRLYITGHMGWQNNWYMAEILTHYACEIDAEYYQGKTNVTAGRELLPYSERYQYIDVKNLQEMNPEGLYVVCKAELETFPFAYEVIDTVGNFVLLTGTQ